MKPVMGESSYGRIQLWENPENYQMLSVINDFDLQLVSRNVFKKYYH